MVGRPEDRQARVGRASHEARPGRAPGPQTTHLVLAQPQADQSQARRSEGPPPMENF